VKKSGAFYSYGETRLGQGRENSKEFLTQHPEIADSIETRIRSGSSNPEDPPVDTAEAAPADNGYRVPSASELEQPE
jgi:recombination protein RecA